MENLLASQSYDEAFRIVLSAKDVTLLSWLLNAVAPDDLFSQAHPLLSQAVLIALLQQISVRYGSRHILYTIDSDITTLISLGTDTTKKLEWLMFVLPDLDPRDGTFRSDCLFLADFVQLASVAPHLAPILRDTEVQLRQLEPVHARVVTHLMNVIKRTLAAFQ